MPLKIVRNDITRMQCEAIVNTAAEYPVNTIEEVGAGCDKAIHMAAGADELIKARQEIGFLEEGESAITPGFKLPARYIIHTVSPIYIDGESGEDDKLRSCYRTSLAIALEHDIKSIAFPLIATGSFGYPREEGLLLALDVINEFLLKHDMLIYIVVFSTEDSIMGARLAPDFEMHIDHEYVDAKRAEEYGDAGFGTVDEHDPRYKAFIREQDEFEKAFLETEKKREYIKLREKLALMEQQQTFAERLFMLIDEKGLSNKEVYTDSLLGRKVFSKIKNDTDYHPNKKTAMCLCIGLKLNVEEASELLARAGYAFSPCDPLDVIFLHHIENGKYDMIDLDIELEEYGLPCFIS